MAAGEFDDLIPSSPPQAAPAAGGSDDFSDLIPSQAQPTLGQEAAAPFQALGSMAINSLSPVGAAAEMLLRGKLSHADYAAIKKKWDYNPDNPAAQDDLQFIAGLPGIKQLGQLAQAGGDAVESATGGAIKSNEAQDAVNSGLALLGMRSGGIAPAADIGADTSKLWKLNPAQGGVNQMIINSSWAQAIGENATKLTQNVLARAQKRITAVFDAVESPDKQYNIVVPQTVEGLQKIVDTTTPELATNPTLKRFVDKLNASGGQMNGQELGEFAHRIGEAAKSADGKYELQQGLFRVRDEIQDLVKNGLSPEEAQAYDTARSQYRALNGQLLARTGNLNTMTGDVNAASVARFLYRTDRKGYIFGGNTTPAYDAARFGELKQGNNTALFDQVASAAAQQAGLGGMVTRAAQRAGISTQWVAQVGLPTALRSLARNADFMAALQQEMNNQRQQQQPAGPNVGGE